MNSGPCPARVSYQQLWTSSLDLGYNTKDLYNLFIHYCNRTSNLYHW
jgi:hypothetical protein